MSAIQQPLTKAVLSPRKMTANGYNEGDRTALSIVQSKLSAMSLAKRLTALDPDAVTTSGVFHTAVGRRVQQSLRPIRRGAIFRGGDAAKDAMWSQKVRVCIGAWGSVVSAEQNALMLGRRRGPRESRCGHEMQRVGAEAESVAKGS